MQFGENSVEEKESESEKDLEEIPENITEKDEA